MRNCLIFQFDKEATQRSVSACLAESVILDQTFDGQAFYAERGDTLQDTMCRLMVGIYPNITDTIMHAGKEFLGLPLVLTAILLPSECLVGTRKLTFVHSEGARIFIDSAVVHRGEGRDADITLFGWQVRSVGRFRFINVDEDAEIPSMCDSLDESTANFTSPSRWFMQPHMSNSGSG